MSTVGIYRYKMASVSASGNTVVFKVGGVTTKTCTVRPLSLCTGKRILKYLNKDGQYRFYAFSNYYEEIDQPKEIGKVGNLITQILSSKSSTKSLGYKSDRILRLTSELIPTADLILVRDIYTSPRVYLYVGTTGDTENDWILVTVKASNAIRKESKALFTTMELEVTLPETYTIRML